MRQAASVLLLRDRPAAAGGGVEVLMLRRAERGGDFRSGAAVFPGGVLDPRDRLAHPVVDGWDDAQASARLGVAEGGLDYLVAAIRECFEEVGVLCATGDAAARQAAHVIWRAPLQDGRASLAELCAALDLRLPVAGWSYLAHWVTPPGMPRRFDTRFFVGQAPADQEPVADAGEAQDAFWRTPAEALADDSGLVLLPVTRALLAWLAPHHTVEAALAAARAQVEVPCIMPRRARQGERGTILLPESAAYDEVAHLDPEGEGSVQAVLVAGVPVRLSPRVIRVTAPNPGLMTGAGTNSYLVGDPAVNRWTVIDPGPDDARHLDALVAAVPGPIERVLLTHAHPDHADGASSMARRVGVPVWGMHAALSGLDEDIPYREMFGGERMALGQGTTLVALHTPGHAPEHLAFRLEEERLLFAGDLVMQGGTVVIDPPEGDMGAYLGSLEAMAASDLLLVAPAHGFLMANPAALFRGVIHHRMRRESKIIDALKTHHQALFESLVPTAYSDAPAVLWPLAARSLLAHLLHLQGRGVVTREGDQWRLAGPQGMDPLP
ncbi:MAG: MBL fold metallo-hydrolase [Gemmatimonadetes bacterium]|nr:MBL fold metallo-hydrolase [Gemmatimonadota bacterium]